ncbi:cation:proton antiporter [Streptococcus dentiloxodontae]
MHISILVITVLFALILSNVLNRIFPKLPLPLIQIVFGGVIGLFQGEHSVAFDTEIFLAFVIAPLLFREGEESDITSVLKNWKLILFLIFPIVFVTTIGLGFVAKSILPIEVPLAACLALGAALGPTDLVAFSALSRRFSFPKRVSHILQGEGLLNDASGLVAFQVAATALITGTFSLADASFSLLVSVIGGFLVGIGAALLNRLILSILDNVDASDVIGALLLELALPIVSYFLAEEIQVSGIIAVVVAGISQASRFKKITLFDAQVDKVSQVVWNTISFMLNGLVFLLLGLELTELGEPVLTTVEYSNLSIFLVIIVLTALLFAIRFVMIAIFAAYVSLRRKRPFRRMWKTVSLLTLSGVKGTVSIATILLLPKALPSLEYSMLIFTVAGVTLLSFLVGILTLPHLAGAPLAKGDRYVEIAIINEVIRELEKDLLTAEHQAPIYAAIDNYNHRLENLILDQESNEIKAELALIRYMIMGIESEGLEYAYQQGTISIKEYRIYQTHIKNLERRINRGFISSISYAFLVLLQGLRRLLRELVTLGASFRRFRRWQKSDRGLTEENRDHIAELYLTNTEQILSALAGLEGIYNSNLLAYMKRNRLQEAEIIQSQAFVERVITRLMPTNIDEMLRGYYLERKFISQYEADNLISHRYAKRLRKEVNILEDYSLKESSNTLSYDMINLIRRQY